MIDEKQATQKATRPASRWWRRFWDRVDRAAGPDGCWPWTGCFKDKREKYGVVWFANRTWKAHRIAYYDAFGPFDESLLVCHRCDNPPCCNPAHLFLGTDLDNQRDARAKGRHPSAKLTWAEVRKIRGLYSTGTISGAALGRQFGVTQGSIWKIVSGRCWRDPGVTP